MRNIFKIIRKRLIVCFQGTSTLFPALPIGTVVILALIISYKSASNLFETHTTLYCVSFGIVAAKVWIIQDKISG